MEAWSPRRLLPSEREVHRTREVDRMAARLLGLRDPDAVWQRLVSDAWHLLDATTVRGFALHADGGAEATATAGAAGIPVGCERVERALIGRAVACGRSLRSDDPSLDRDLAALAAALATTSSAVHVLLLPADRAALGLVAVHWVTAAPPDGDRLARFAEYWDCAGLAVAAER